MALVAGQAVDVEPPGTAGHTEQAPTDKAMPVAVEVAVELRAVEAAEQAKLAKLVALAVERVVRDEPILSLARLSCMRVVAADVVKVASAVLVALAAVAVGEA
jgi:hypothetical protein